MKIISIILMFVLVALTHGCDSYRWESELYALSQEDAQLRESYRNGELSEPAYSNLVVAANQAILKIITEHKKELFQTQLEDLHAAEISIDIIELISESLSFEKRDIEPFWKERESGDELIRMNPKGMTMRVLMRQLTQEEYLSISSNPQPVKVLEISANTCRTAMLNSNGIYTVSFTKEGLSWTPVAFHKYTR